MPQLDQLIVQCEGMLRAMSDSGFALTLQALQLTGRGAGNHEVGLLRLAVLEHPGPLEHKGTALPNHPSNDSFQSDESRRTVAAVHHEVFDLSFSFDITGVA